MTVGRHVVRHARTRHSKRASEYLFIIEVVPEVGLEPTSLAAGDFESPASTIPPLGLLTAPEYPLDRSASRANETIHGADRRSAQQKGQGASPCPSTFEKMYDQAGLRRRRTAKPPSAEITSKPPAGSGTSGTTGFGPVKLTRSIKAPQLPQPWNNDPPVA